MAEHQYPLGHVFYRKLNKRLPLIVRGEGCWLVDETGKRYLDACGGAFVANLGHGLSDIGDAMAEQARQVAYVNGTTFTHHPVEELAAEVAALSPGDLNRVYPLSSGSEAVEAALKFARQYWVETGRPKKHRIVALTPAYHGNTLLALSASAREHYKTYYREWLVDVIRVPAPYAYRCACHGRPPLCPACDGSAVEQAIVKAGPESVAVFIAEPVGGSSSGATVPGSMITTSWSEANCSSSAEVKRGILLQIPICQKASTFQTRRLLSLSYPKKIRGVEKNLESVDSLNVFHT